VKIKWIATGSLKLQQAMAKVMVFRFYPESHISSALMSQLLITLQIRPTSIANSAGLLLCQKTAKRRATMV
jgi:hypothetical protein